MRRGRRRASCREAPGDDVAFLAARIPPLPTPDDALAGRRRSARRDPPAAAPLAARAGRERDEIYDIIVACQEACANAIEHAYGPGGATFDVEAVHDGGRVTRDGARPRAVARATGTHRGRGLTMMRALMDSVDVRQADEGTTVVLRRTLRREAA